MLQNSSFRENDMTKTFFDAIDYQRQLIFAGLEDFTPNSALPNVLGGQYGTNPVAWRQAVIDFICRNVAADLLEIVSYPGKPTEMGAPRVRALLISGDESRGLDENIIWDAIYFTGTTKLKSRLKSFGLLSWDALNAEKSDDFIDFLVDSYTSG
ncbi:conserved protein of unknown function (plasmid) [Cupriavidus taiwanensis]|uniref:Uncharacterized protein n=2 Tax=Cupriavidus taiwanensis TaxID=164546 RepID=A0A7Z7JFA6_9BURK|nr:protein of unknown function [Cupriavidus taiwanensis]SOZ11983.1 protein of unknown function [Cupriavidus taiwanensis]SOZ43340.1 protein of unknown function [Cupriavidus taiwanensis]SPC22583.1 protein of unknown function [Cupriavidus taiwanensis]SPD54094.1 conserved protein of unknown function [Cupriavidus taiwanensis]